MDARIFREPFVQGATNMARDLLCSVFALSATGICSYLSCLGISIRRRTISATGSVHLRILAFTT